MAVVPKNDGASTCPQQDPAADPSIVTSSPPLHIYWTNVRSTRSGVGTLRRVQPRLLEIEEFRHALTERIQLLHLSFQLRCGSLRSPSRAACSEVQHNAPDSNLRTCHRPSHPPYCRASPKRRVPAPAPDGRGPRAVLSFAGPLFPGVSPFIGPKGPGNSRMLRITGLPPLAKGGRSAQG